MSYGLQPTQREEWKEKHKTRLFFEERIVEVQYIFTHSILFTYNALFSLYRLIVKNKKFIFKAFLALLVAVTLAI